MSGYTRGELNAEAREDDARTFLRAEWALENKRAAALLWRLKRDHKHMRNLWADLDALREDYVEEHLEEYLMDMADAKEFR